MLRGLLCTLTLTMFTVAGADSLHPSTSGTGKFPFTATCGKLHCSSANNPMALVAYHKHSHVPLALSLYCLGYKLEACQ